MIIKFHDGHELSIPQGKVTISVFTDSYGHVKGELWVQDEKKQMVRNGISFRFKEVASIEY